MRTTQRSRAPGWEAPSASRSWRCVGPVASVRPQPGHVLDEARAVNRTVASLPAADEDYFHDMDGAIALTPDEVKGRNIVDRVDRRQRSALGRADHAQELRHASIS